LLGLESNGVAEQVFQVINSAPMDDRRKLYQQIVLSGGTTMYPGFATRLGNELEKIYRERILKGDKEKSLKDLIRVEAPPRRKNMVFLGGAVYATLIKDTPTLWISRQDYAEMGPERCVQRLNEICPR